MEMTNQNHNDRVIQGSYTLKDVQEKALAAKKKLNAVQALLYEVMDQEADDPQDGRPITGKRAEAVHNGAAARDAADTLQEFKHALVYKGTAAEAADYLDDADRYILLSVCEKVASQAGLELVRSETRSPSDAAWERIATARLGRVNDREWD